MRKLNCSHRHHTGPQTSLCCLQVHEQDDNVVMRTGQSRFSIIIVALVTCSFNIPCPQTEADYERKSPNIADSLDRQKETSVLKALVQANIPTFSSYFPATGKNTLDEDLKMPQTAEHKWSLKAGGSAEKKTN